MVLTDEQKRRIVEIFNYKKYQQEGKVEIIRLTRFNERPIIYGLNLSTMGTVSISETMKFIKQLNEAINIVKKLNK